MIVNGVSLISGTLERMGTTQSAIARLEGGGAKPTLQTHENLAAADLPSYPAAKARAQGPDRRHKGNNSPARSNPSSSAWALADAITGTPQIEGSAMGVAVALGMALSKQSIRDDLTVAMKARDADVTGTLRMLLAAVGNAEVAGKEQIELSHDQIITIIRAETKKRVDSAELYTTGGRPELAAKEQSEIAILSRYMPAEMPDDELNAIITTTIVEAAAGGNTGPKALGAVMKAVKEKVGGNVDGGRMSAAVKAALA